MEDFKKVDIKGSVVEFFLGKNVIAKIALILIFLGLVSFGQLAYVKWLTDIGRVLFIILIGTVFGALGYYFERLRNEVFFNVFYILSVLSIFLALILGRYMYEVVHESVLNYGIIAIMVSTLIYFYNKRSTFFDSFMIIFYTIMATFKAVYFIDVDYLSSLFEYTIILVILGYAYFRFFNTYLKDKHDTKAFVGLVLFIILLVQNFVLAASEMHQLYPGVVYTLFSLYVLYLMNLQIVKSSKTNFNTVVVMVTMFVLICNSINIALIIDEYIPINNSLIFLIYAVLTGSLYIVKFIFKYESDSIRRTYLGLTTIGLLLYSFVAGPNNYWYVYDYNVLNFITIIIVYLFYVSQKFTKKLELKYVSYLFISVLVFRNVIFLLENPRLHIVQLDIYIPTLIAFIGLLALNQFKYNRQELHENIEQVGFHFITMLAILPVALTLIKTYLTDDFSILFGSAIILIIGYRYLLTLDFFKFDHKDKIVSFIDGKIVALIFVVNLTYFNHDFTKFFDIFKFLYIFGLNVYVILPLRSIFNEYKHIVGEETFFIILYSVGALVQSFFIHNYINFEIDKVILSSYFMIASAVGVLFGFKNEWLVARRIALGCIYYSLAKFFIYDFYFQDLTTEFRMVTYFILGFTLLGISFMYNYLEKTFGIQNDLETQK